MLKPSSVNKQNKSSCRMKLSVCILILTISRHFGNASFTSNVLPQLVSNENKTKEFSNQLVHGMNNANEHYSTSSSVFSGSMIPMHSNIFSPVISHSQSIYEHTFPSTQNNAASMRRGRKSTLLKRYIPWAKESKSWMKIPNLWKPSPTVQLKSFKLSNRIQDYIPPIFKQLSIYLPLLLGKNTNTSPKYPDVNHPVAEVMRMFGIETSGFGLIAMNIFTFITEKLISYFLVPTPTSKVEGRNAKPLLNSLFAFPDFNQISSLFEAVTSQYLPQQILSAIGDSSSSEYSSCARQMVCTTTPIIRGMQKSLIDVLNLKTHRSEEKQSKTIINWLSKYLPSLQELQKRQTMCEKQYPLCNWKT